MTDHRFDLGRRAGPDFLPVQAGPPPRPTHPPAAQAPPTASAAAGTPAGEVAGPAPAAHRRSAGRTVALLTACLICGTAAGGAGGLLVASVVDGRTTIRQYQPGARGLGTVPDAQTAAEALLPTVVEVSAGRSRGSGFAIDDRGHIMTNSHVVQGFSRVLVRLADGRQSAARVVGTDTDSDIAVLAIAGDPPPPATLGMSSSLRIGQPVIAVGAPLGLNSTVTAGIVSAIDRTARLGSAGRQQLPMVQTDASINPGNSGGPLANLQGQVVGMNTAIATVGGPGTGNIGIGFAVPIDHAAAIARRIIDND